MTATRPLDAVRIWDSAVESWREGHSTHVCSAEGAVRTVAAVPDDPEAVRACESAGYGRGGTIGYFRLGRWRRSFVRRCGETGLRVGPG